MSRADRLLALMQSLRRRRYPVNGQALADELGVSLRTLYRDIAALQARGASIEGSPGVGYLLRPGFMLPPLMFSEDEIHALVLGSRWVARRGDPVLQQAATDALSKIASVLPHELRQPLEESGLWIASDGGSAEEKAVMESLRHAMHRQFKLDLDYHDVQGAGSQRRVWPLALAFFDQVQVLVAWCELRGDFRHFRTDRIAACRLQEERYAENRLQLLARWRRQQQLPAPAGFSDEPA